jgi:hypothetical protein
VTGQIYPSDAATGWGKQSSWYLSSHGSYGGLFTNANFRADGNLSVGGSVYASSTGNSLGDLTVRAGTNFQNGVYMSAGAMTVGGPATFATTVTFAANVWINSSEGYNRLYFGSSSITYISGNGVTFRNLSASDIVTIDASGNTVVGGTLQSGGGMFPGRYDLAATNGLWAIYGHGSYGLHINTGLHVAGNVWTDGNLYGHITTNWIVGTEGPADFSVDTGGTWTPTTVFSAIWHCFNNMLTMTWMCDGNFNGGAFAIRIPGGHTAGRYAQSRGVFLDGAQHSFTWDHRIEVGPGSPWVYCYMNGGISISGTCRYGGQICIYIGG